MTYLGFWAIISPNLLRIGQLKKMMNRATRSHPEGRPGDKTTKKQSYFRFLPSAFCLLLPLMLVSCSMITEEPQRRDVDDLRRHLRENERTQAELKSRVDELQNRFDMLEARVKELQNRLKNVSAKGQLEEGLLEPPLAADKTVREHDVITPSSSALAPAPSPAASLPEPKTSAAKEPYSTAKGQSQEKVEIASGEVMGAKMLYDEAFRNYRAGNYSRARLLFQEYTKKFPQEPLAPNALYWQGECLYDQRSYQEALITFQKVVDLYPQSLKAPDALYKKGLCYLDLKQEQQAAEEFKTVLTKYPKSEIAKSAQEKLSALSGRQGRRN